MAADPILGDCVIDLHCHLLPGIDDGPPTMDGSLALARRAVAGGTRTIVVTPHVNYEWPHVDAARIAEGVAAVREALAAAGIVLEVRTGAEVAMTRAVDLDDDELRALRLGGGPWLLLECPLSPSAAGFEAVARSLQARGHRLLLAHPERSPAFQRDTGLLERLVADGMLAQVTASSFAGAFGRNAEQAARRMLAAGLLADAASDAHSAQGPRDPAFGPGLLDAGLPLAVARHLALDAPAAIVAGTPVPPAPAVAPSPGAERAGGLRRRLRRA